MTDQLPRQLAQYRNGQDASRAVALDNRDQPVARQLICHPVSLRRPAIRMNPRYSHGKRRLESNMTLLAKLANAPLFR
jgi:hypothetical protein